MIDNSQFINMIGIYEKHSQLGALDRALEHANLRAQGKDLQLKRGACPKRGAKEREKGR
jgi:hypothetical protein